MTTKIRKRGKKAGITGNLNNMIAAIKTQVQAFATHLSSVVRDSEALAPQVAAAFQKFRADVKGTRLEFLKLLATKEQLAEWPKTDMEAKAVGSPIQSLFNSVDYLLRKAAAMKRDDALQLKIDNAAKDAAQHAAKEGKARGLAGPELELYIAKAEQDAVDAITRQPARVAQDDVSGLILQGWDSDLDDFDTFVEFVAAILSLKYSAKTVEKIVGKARETVEATPPEQEKVPEQPATAPISRFKIVRAPAA